MLANKMELNGAKTKQKSAKRLRENTADRVPVRAGPSIASTCVPSGNKTKGEDVKENEENEGKM